MQKSCKGTSCIAYLEKLINEIDSNLDLTRSGKFNRAIVKAQNLAGKQWVELSKELKKFKATIPSDITVPTALQLKVDENLEVVLDTIERKLKEALSLSTLQTRYEIEIIWLFYLNELKRDTMLVGKPDIQADLSGPEMVKRLVEILMLNRKQDAEIIAELKRILLKWEV